MSLLVNIKQLEERNEELAGELAVSELAFGFDDEVARFSKPLKYRLEVQRLADSLLLQGVLELPVICSCVRCLKEIPGTIHLSNWVCHIPLEGEEHAAVVRDSVDLTPYIREDIVLALPTHPVCRDDCPGLIGTTKQTLRTARSGTPESISSPWDELNKLKLKR
jgi:uncharacterized protein